MQLPSDPSRCRRIPSGFVAALAIVVAGCGSGGDESSAISSTAVRPFSEVQAAEFVFGADPTTPERGIFRVVLVAVSSRAFAHGAYADAHGSVAVDTVAVEICQITPEQFLVAELE